MRKLRVRKLKLKERDKEEIERMLFVIHSIRMSYQYFEEEMKNKIVVSENIN